MATPTITPEVLWAQRSSSSDPEMNFIFLTINVPDVPASNLKLDLQPKTLTFTGHSDTLKKTYHLDIEFYDEVDPAETKINHTNRDIQVKLRKKELKDEYWPRLLKEAKKLHFLKTDFDKWVDEDEQNEAGDEDFSSQFGAGAGGGMGGMPGMGGMGMDGGLGGIDFSKLGGMGGMGGMGGGDMEDDDEGSDDDDMPGLEGEEDEETGVKAAEVEEEGAAEAPKVIDVTDEPEATEAPKAEAKA